MDEVHTTVLGYAGDAHLEETSSGAWDPHGDPFVTKIGGEAVLHHSLPSPGHVLMLNSASETTLPSENEVPPFRPYCWACGELMSLAVQAYAPLAIRNDLYRSLLLFVCASGKQCKLGSSWRAFRAQWEPDDETEEQECEVTPETVWSEGDWTANDEPQSATSCTNQTLNLINIVEKLKSSPTSGVQSSPTSGVQRTDQGSQRIHVTPSKTHKPPASTSFEIRDISVDYEPGAKSTHSDSYAQKLFAEYQRTSGHEDEDTTEDNECDKMLAKRVHKDKSFRQFQKRIARSPEQILRYCFGGPVLPLSDSHPPPAALPMCPTCGTNRVFEMQLLPSMMEFLTLRTPPAPPPTVPTPQPSAPKPKKKKNKKKKKTKVGTPESTQGTSSTPSTAPTTPTATTTATTATTSSVVVDSATSQTTTPTPQSEPSPSLPPAHSQPLPEIEAEADSPVKAEPVAPPSKNPITEASSSMDFGLVVVFSCAHNCGSTGLFEEHVWVHPGL
ncbi:pre-rRNA-processing protein TSR4 [Pelomyxa schiedti]|nr:pre-rRNA-processing protein TSR4 [Pelomyxa schiedti]